MGINFRELVAASALEPDALVGQTLAVDSFNLLYQFLTTIRQSDGTPLMDAKGRVTSHLSGLFSRTASLLQKNIRLAFVFDGTPPTQKRAETERRRQLKLEAVRAYEIAKEREDIGAMKRYASRTVRLTPEILDEARTLMQLFGCPVIQAPSEGEAQAAHIVKAGLAYAVVSQDFDSLLFGAMRLVRNLSIAGRRKRGPTSVEVKPELIILKDTLTNLKIDGEQLIALAMLIGTDFNVGGIRGIGPKKALALVQKHSHDYETLFAEAKWQELFETGWQDIFNLFRDMPVTDDYTLEWRGIDRNGIISFMCDEHDFSRERIEHSLAGFRKRQKGLAEFF